MKELNIFYFDLKKYYVTFLMVIALCFSSSSFAAVITWDGGGGLDQNWSTASNWSGDAVPGSADQITISGSCTPTITSNVGTINQLILTETSAGAPTLIISATGVLSVTNTTATAQSQVRLNGGSIQNAGSLTIITAVATSGSALVFANGSGSTAASYSGNGTLTINSSAAGSSGTPAACIYLAQTTANPVLTVGGTFNLVAKNYNGGVVMYAIYVGNGANATINGTGVLSVGTSSTPVSYGLISMGTAGGSNGGSLTVGSGVTLNVYSTELITYLGAISLFGTVNNTFTNKGTINLSSGGSSSSYYGLYTSPGAGLTYSVSNEGTMNFNSNGSFKTSAIRLGGNGTTSFTNSGAINIDNIPAGGDGIGMSAAPTVNITNTGSITLGASGANTAAITLGDSKAKFDNNGGTVTINKGYLTGTAGAGKAKFNNNTAGIFRSNVGSSNIGINTNITFTNQGFFEGSCIITDAAFVPSIGTLSPGGPTGIGMLIFNSTTDLALAGNCVMNVNGSTTAGTDYDQIKTPTSKLNVTAASLVMTLGGSYVPSNLDLIPLFTASSLTGPFSSSTLPANWANQYTSTNANIKYYAPVISVNSNTNISALEVQATTDINVSNGVLLTIDANSAIHNLTINGGGKVTNVDKSLTVNEIDINSDAINGTGTFVDLNPTGGLTVSGTASVQQYLTSGRNWYVSSPVASAATSIVTGGAGNALYSYDEPSASWVTTDASFGLTKGYIANIALSGTVTFTGGALNNGAITSPSLTSSGMTKTGFNLVGNPYPSYVNWESATTTNLLSTMWYRTKNGSSAYVFDTYNATDHLGTANNGTAVTQYIPPMQAVWVRVTAGNTGTLGFDNTMRSHQDQSVTTNRLKAPAKVNTVQQVLRLQVSNGINSDEAIMLFNANASDGYDAYDSPKMSNANAAIPEIYTLAGTEQVVINGLNSLTPNEELPLGFTTGQSNTFTIKATEISNLDADTKIVLKDNLLNSEQELTVGSDYSFSSNVTSDASRFSIIFRSAGAVTGIIPNTTQTLSVFKNVNGQITIFRNNAMGEGTVTICNAVGQKLLNCSTTGTTTVVGKSFTSGVYLVTVNVKGNKTTKKVIIN